MYIRNCLICHAVHTHIIDTDCTEEHFSQWELGQNQVNFVRHCTICGKEEIHYVDTDCQDCFGEWELTEDALSYVRSCTICGKEEIHAVHGDCAQEHFGAWELSEDELNYIRSCTICGKTETHIIDIDCEDHYSQWTDCEDGVHQERICGICGNTQTQQIQPDEPVVTPVYTVTVVDQEGNAVAGVYVQLCDDHMVYAPQTTGEDGVVIFEKEGLVGAKAKVISAEGYTFSEEYALFGDDNTLTIVINQIPESSEEPDVQ